MKQINITILLTMLMSMVGVKAFASTKIDGIYYKFSGTNATVTYGARYSNKTAYEGDIVIPETVTHNETTYKVTAIGDNAFNECSDLTSVVIPESVTTIGSYAFVSCSGLVSVNIPESVMSIGSSAFLGCSKLTTINIPNGVTSIKESSFQGCSSLTSITIPNSVVSIEKAAFLLCNGLTSITIGKRVKDIGFRAIASCEKLKEIYCYAAIPPTTESEDFTYLYKKSATLHVPEFSLLQYKADAVWGQFSFGEPLSFSVWFTYSVAGLAKMKMEIEEFLGVTKKLNIAAEEGWKLETLTLNGEDKTEDVEDGLLNITFEGDTEVDVNFAWADEDNLYTEDPITGIATIEGEGVEVQAKDGQIWINGAAGKTVRLYTVGGALMTTVIPTTGMIGKFSVSAGTYIVQVGSKAAKIVVQ